MFGRRSRRSQLFDIVGALGDPDMVKTYAPVDRGDPMEEAPGAQPSGPPRTKFFGRGGAGRAIAGTIGDYLLQQAHMQPVYAPTMQREQEMEQRMQLYQQQRQDEYADWQKRQEYEAAHRQASPTELERNVEYFTRIGRPDLAEAAQAKAAAMIAQGVDPATGQPIIQAVNPASLFPRPGQQPAGGGGSKPLTDEDIRRMEQGGAGQGGPRTFRPRRLFGGAY